MEPRALAVALARARIALGAAAIVAPAAASRFMFGRKGAQPGTNAFARMLGGRDMALGLGVVIALDRGAPVRGWLEAGALADTVDLVGTVLARHAMPKSAFVNIAGAAGGFALAGAWLSRQLDPPPDADPGHPEAVVTGHPG